MKFKIMTLVAAILLPVLSFAGQDIPNIIINTTPDPISFDMVDEHCMNHYHAFDGVIQPDNSVDMSLLARASGACYFEYSSFDVHITEDTPSGDIYIGHYAGDLSAAEGNSFSNGSNSPYHVDISEDSGAEPLTTTITG